MGAHRSRRRAGRSHQRAGPRLSLFRSLGRRSRRRRRRDDHAARRSDRRWCAARLPMCWRRAECAADGRACAGRRSAGDRGAGAARFAAAARCRSGRCGRQPASRSVQTAIASRAALPCAVSAAIAEVGSAEACLMLHRKSGAEIAPFSLDRIVERFGHLAAIREPLLQRDDLAGGDAAGAGGQAVRDARRFRHRARMA